MCDPTECHLASFEDVDRFPAMEIVEGLQESQSIGEHPQERQASARHADDADAFIVLFAFEFRPEAVHTHGADAVPACGQFTSQGLDEASDAPVRRGRVFGANKTYVQMGPVAF